MALKFLISAQFAGSPTSTPNSMSNTEMVNGVDYSELYIIQNLLTDLFSKPEIADWLSSLNGNIYITKGVDPSTGLGNASWRTSLSGVQATDVFFEVLPKVELVDPDGSGPSGPVPTANMGISAQYSATSSAKSGFIDLSTDAIANINSVFQFTDQNQNSHNMSLKRTIFHELTHARTLILQQTARYFYGTLTPGSPPNPKYFVAEAIAADAENLVYRQAYPGEAIRVGHVPSLSIKGNDPIAAFAASGKIEFSAGSYDAVGNHAAIISQEFGNDHIKKIYGQANFSITSTGSPYVVNNYILIKGVDGDGGLNQIILDSGAPSALFSTVLNGIASDNVVSSGVLTNLATQVNEMNTIGNALALSVNPSLHRLAEISTRLKDLDHGTVTTVVGLSAELSAVDDERTGPHIADATSNELYIEATDSGSLILGASGTAKNNVNYSARTDYLRGSGGDDILVAGTGQLSGAHNVLEGKEGSDILVGRDKDDKLLGGDGDDTAFLSLGADIIEGGDGAGTDTLVVANSLGSVTVNLRLKDGAYSSFAVGSGTSKVKGIEVFVGNTSKTIFKGNGEGSVFIAGSGGGEFHLYSNDQAIGHAGVEDKFYVTTMVPTEFATYTQAQKIAYLETNRVYIGNFGVEDKVFVNGVQFNGNKVRTRLWGETIAPDWNRDDPHNAYALTGDSSYGTAYANPNFEVRGASYSGEPWGALSYADMQYRDVNYTATSDSGLGIVNLFARGITGVETGGSSASAGQTGYTFNSLTAADEQLMVVIDGFQNGFGGITFENDGLANLRPGVPNAAGDDGYWPNTQNFATNWGESEPVISVSDEEDIFDGNVDGRMSPGGAAVTPDDPRFNLGELAYGGAGVDWDAVLSGPRILEGSSDGDFLDGGWANDEIAGGDGDDVIYGGPGDDILDGGAGNDEIYGGDGNDTLLGGDGDDLLFGEAGRNIVNGGDGDDTAYLEGSQSDYRIYRKLDGTVVAEYLYGAGNVQTFTNVETLTFYDGSIEPGDLPMGTSGNDILVGSSRADLLDGGAGDDDLTGGDGDDIYVVDAVGDIVTENMYEGTDTVRTSLASHILGANVENLIFTGSGSFAGTGNDIDNVIVGGTNNDVLAGGLGYDRFVSGGGSDLIDGGDDSDTLVLVGKPGDYSYSVDVLGVVTVTDGTSSVALTDVEYIEFDGGRGFEVSELLAKYVVGTAGNDALLEGDSADNVIRGLAGDDGLRGGEGSDLLDGGDGLDTAHYAGNSADYAIYRSPTAGLTVNDETGADGADFLSNIESLHFDGDNVTIDVSTVAPLGTSAHDTITGSSRRDRLYGLAGNDSLAGANGDDLIDGGAGDDTLDGGAGQDVLLGGAGNDINIFGTGDDFASDTSGDDTYIYAAGDGDDRIQDYGGTDAIILGSSITPGDVTFSVDSDDIILHFAGGGSLTLHGGLAEGNEIEEIRFDDTTVWNPIVRLQTATSGNDTLIGTISADTLAGGAGNDSIEGRQGNDTLVGDIGDDMLSGGAGDDTYLFALGDGVDIIQDDSTNFNYGGGGNDTLIFGVGISPIDIQVSMANGSDLVLTIAGTADQITLKNSVLRESENIETVQFSDTTIWTHADLMSKALVSTTGNDSLYGSFAADTISGGAGNDNIVAREGDDILTGGTGNDNITGGAGNDTYYFNLGDGQDYISDFTSAGSSVDAIVFGAGILPADIVVKQTDNGWDLVLSITGTSDKITINDAAFVDAYRIEEVRFADSTVWTHNDLMAKAYSPKTTGDTYWGTSGADTISGGAGNDLIIASGGNDTLAGGTGNDTLYGDAGTDTVLLMGLSATYSMVTSGGFLRVTDNAPTVDGNDGTDELRGVEKLRFGDNQEVGIVSPIILDLDGRGVTTVSAYIGSARYDMDSDGVADITSWMGRGEGMLFLDRDRNGTLSNAGEFSFVSDVDGAASDLVGLRAFDSDGDGTLSSLDNRFADFRIWRDGNGNGSVQAGEVLSLTEAGVASLNLSGQAVEGNTAIGEVAILNTGSFTRTDGQTGQFIDAALTYFSGASESRVTGPAAPHGGILARRRLDALDRNSLGGGGRRELQVERQDARDPIAHWPSFGDQRMWSGPAIASADEPDRASASRVSPSAAASSIDRRLALLVQGMSTFSVQSASEAWTPWQHENGRPLDFFA